MRDAEELLGVNAVLARSFSKDVPFFVPYIPEECQFVPQICKDSGCVIGGIGGPVPEKPSVFIHVNHRVCKQKRAVVHMFCSVCEKSFLHETSPVC